MPRHDGAGRPGVPSPTVARFPIPFVHCGFGFRSACSRSINLGHRSPVASKACTKRVRRKTLKAFATDQSSPVRWSAAYPALVFAVVFVFIFLLHLPLLQLS